MDAAWPLRTINKIIKKFWGRILKIYKSIFSNPYKKYKVSRPLPKS